MGLGEMNLANEGLVQQTSAAAEALNQRIETLKRTVQIFHLQ